MKILPTTTPQQVADQLVALLNSERAAGKSILLLLSGGSCTEVAVKALSGLAASKNAPPLHLGLIDERFGATGHKDSNWQQLLDAGLGLVHFEVHPVLHDGLSADETTGKYNQLITRLLGETDLSVGLFGIGTDGHTAGILPGSPIISSTQTVAHYQAADFERISITPSGIRGLGKALVFAVGQAKWPALQQMTEKGPLDRIPARIFQELNDVTLYTDYMAALKGDVT